MVSLSIIIVTHNRVQMLKELLSCIFQSDFSFEVIVVNNSHQSIDISEFNTFVINQVHATPGEARNTGLSFSKNEWVLFLDDDTLLPENYFSNCLSFITSNEDQLDIIGGPDQTPLNTGFFQECLGLCLQSSMTTAKTRYRHTSSNIEVKSGDEKNLILCNLWIKRNFLKAHSISFNKKFFRNEENILITESIKVGARVVYKPDFFVYHYRKTRVFPLFRTTFLSGKFRAKSFFYSSKLFSFIFLIPAFWVLYLLTLPLTSCISTHFKLPLLLYFLLSVLFSLKVASGNPIKAIAIMAYQVEINFSYGLGILIGLLLNGLNIGRSFRFYF